MAHGQIKQQEEPHLPSRQPRTRGYGRAGESASRASMPSQVPTMRKPDHVLDFFIL